MSIAGLNRVIDLLKSIDDSPESKMGFHMNWEPEHANDANHPCGSACCIGGWCWLTLRAEHKLHPQEDIIDAVVKMAEVDTRTADKICFPPAGIGAYEATKEQAIRMLEILRDEGEVDWLTAMETV